MRLSGIFLLFLFLFPLAAQETGEGWESFYLEGELVEELLTDSSRRPVKSRSYHKGKLQEVRSYSYGDDRILVDVTGYAPDGTERNWQETLILRDDGSLRMMEKNADNASLKAGWSPRAEWTLGEDRQEILVYGDKGGIRERLVYRGSEKTEEEIFSYDGEGMLLQSDFVRFSTDERRITSYNRAGLAGEIRSYRNGLLVSQTFYSYNERNLLVREETRGGGELTERTLEYGEGDVLAEERFYRNGLIARLVAYEGDGKTEELYNRGRLTLRIIYEGTEIVGEENFP